MIDYNRMKTKLDRTKVVMKELKRELDVHRANIEMPLMPRMSSHSTRWDGGNSFLGDFSTWMLVPDYVDKKLRDVAKEVGEEAWSDGGDNDFMCQDLAKVAYDEAYKIGRDDWLRDTMDDRIGMI